MDREQRNGRERRESLLLRPHSLWLYYHNSVKHCEPRSLRCFHYIITLSVIASRPNNVLRGWQRRSRWIFWQSFIESLLRFTLRWNWSGPETDGVAFKSALPSAQKWRNTTNRLPEKCKPFVFNKLSSPLFPLVQVLVAVFACARYNRKTQEKLNCTHETL